MKESHDRVNRGAGKCECDLSFILVIALFESEVISLGPV